MAPICAVKPYRLLTTRTYLSSTANRSGRPSWNRFQWNEELDQSLVNLRKQGKSLDLIADEMNISWPVIYKRAVELGINGRLKRRNTRDAADD